MLLLASVEPFQCITEFLGAFKTKGEGILCVRLDLLARQDTGQFGPADNADSLHSRFTILHGNLMGIFHFPLAFAFYTICYIF